MDQQSSAHWDMIHKTTSGKNNNDLPTMYNKWSSSYDEDLEKAHYKGPALGARKLSQLLSNKNGRILDVGCGTGLVAQELNKLGFTNIYGADVSEEMIQLARETGLYQDIHLCDINEEGLSDNDDLYDALICVGTFAPGHLNQSVFPEFCRVVKPGGYIVITMREAYIYTMPDFKGQLDIAVVERCEKGIWKYVNRERVEQYIGTLAGVTFSLQMQ